MLSWWTPTTPSIAPGACAWARSACSASARTGARRLLLSPCPPPSPRLQISITIGLPYSHANTQTFVKAWTCLTAQHALYFEVLLDSKGPEAGLPRNTNNPHLCHLFCKRGGQDTLPSAGRRALPVCARAVQIRLHSGASLFYTTRVFPTAGVGTDAGWRYRYPVHEARHFLLSPLHGWPRGHLHGGSHAPAAHRVFPYNCHSAAYCSGNALDRAYLAIHVVKMHVLRNGCRGCMHKA